MSNKEKLAERWTRAVSLRRCCGCMCARALSRRRISRRLREEVLSGGIRMSIREYSMTRDSTRQLSSSFRSASSPARAATPSSSTTSWWCCCSASGSTSANRYISPAATAPPNIMPPWAAASRASTCWAGQRTSTSKVCRWLPLRPMPRLCCPPGAASGGIRRMQSIPSA